MAPTALLRMILQQGDALDRMAGLDLTEPAGVLAGAARIILIGTGTSQHAAELGAMMLAAAGRDARWYPAATWARWGTSPRLGDALLVISHTGETAYAARARAGALAAGVPVVSITGTGRAWPEAIQTVAPDESHTYTVSYTAALAVLARLAHELDRKSTRLNSSHPSISYAVFCLKKKKKPKKKLIRIKQKKNNKS